MKCRKMAPNSKYKTPYYAKQNDFIFIFIARRQTSFRAKNHPGKYVHFSNEERERIFLNISISGINFTGIFLNLVFSSRYILGVFYIER